MEPRTLFVGLRSSPPTHPGCEALDTFAPGPLSLVGILTKACSETGSVPFSTHYSALPLRAHRHLCHIPVKKTLHLFRALSTQGRLGFGVTQGLQGLHLVSNRPRAGHSRRQPQGELLFSQDTGMLIGPFDHCVVCRTEPLREKWRGR